MSIAVVEPGISGAVSVPWPAELASNSSLAPKKHRHQDLIDFTVHTLRQWMTPAAPLPPTHPSYADFAQDPKTDLSVYVQQLLDVSQCPSETLPVALIYMRRVLQKPRCAVTINNVHRLFAVSLMLGSKWLEDQTLCTRDWATVTGIAERTLVRAEREFLQLLGWQVYCDRDEYTELLASGKALGSGEHRAQRSAESSAAA